MRKALDIFFDNVSNIKWDIKFFLRKAFNRGFRNAINLNRRFKNLHFEQRCFIVGNGPSLKSLELSILKKEIVFTVNSIMNNKPLYDSLSSDYHLIFDPGYFKLDMDLKEDKAIIDLLTSINYKDKKPQVFIPYEGKEAFEKYGLTKELNVNFIFQHRYLTDRYRKQIRLDENVPASQNVVQAAIFCALYMGFTKIYLLGVDMTSVFLTYETNGAQTSDIKTGFHAYDYSSDEKKFLTKEFNRFNNETMMYDYGKTFKIFRLIRKYAERRNVEVINLTKGGGLDVFTRNCIESVINA